MSTGGAFKTTPTAGAVTTLRRLALGPLPVMAGHKHHYPGCKSATVQTGRTRPLILEMTEPDEASTEARALYAEPAGLCL